MAVSSRTIAAVIGSLSLILLGAVTAAVADDPPPQAPPPPANAETKTNPEPAETESFIGIFTQPLTAALSAQLQEFLQPQQGLVVVEVLPDSPAVKAGLKPFDVLTTYDGRPVSSVAQFKDLIVADKPGREVALGVIRSAKPRAVRVVLGERRRVPSSLPAAVLQIQIPRTLTEKLNERNHTLDERESKANNGDAQVRPRTAVRDPSAPAGDQQPPPEGVRIRTLTVSRLESAVAKPQERRYKLSLSYDGAKGRERLEREGTWDEIRAGLDDLPADVRDSFRHNLDQSAADKDPARAFRIHIQPRLAGANRSLGLTVTRPGAAGEVRVFELDYTFTEPQEMTVDRLLEIEELAEELNQLAPDIRAKVEATLRRIPVPRIRVQIRNSQ